MLHNGVSATAIHVQLMLDRPRDCGVELEDQPYLNKNVIGLSKQRLI